MSRAPSYFLQMLFFSIVSFWSQKNWNTKLKYKTYDFFKYADMKIKTLKSLTSLKFDKGITYNCKQNLHLLTKASNMLILNKALKTKWKQTNPISTWLLESLDEFAPVITKTNHKCLSWCCIRIDFVQSLRPPTFALLVSTGLFLG